MDNRSEVREFLTSRRAKITAQQAGLPEALHRRVPGLRRSEVAALAGMDVEYYAKLERGSLGGVSASILDGSRALSSWTKPNETTCSTWPTPPTAPAPPYAPRPQPQSLDRAAQLAMDPRLHHHRAGDCRQQSVRSARTNHLGRALYADVYNDPNGAPNFARFTSLTAPPTASTDWDLAADMTVANLRTAAGLDPHYKELHDLIGELSTRSEGFRRRWGAHNVRTHGTGTKRSTTTSSATSPLPMKAWTSEPNPASP